MLPLWIATATIGFQLGPAGRLNAVDVDEAGRVVAAGFTGAEPLLLVDGEPVPLGKMTGKLYAVRAHQGRITIAGAVDAPPDEVAYVARIGPDGTKEMEVRLAPAMPGRGPTTDRFEAVEIDGEGRIVLGGVAYGWRKTSWGRSFVCFIDFPFCTGAETTSLAVRLLSDGRVDPSFGMVLGNEGARWHVGSHDEIIDLTLLKEGFVAVGWASGETYDDERTIVVRYEDGIVASHVSEADSRAGGKKEVLYGVALDGEQIVTAGFSFDSARHIQALTKTYDAKLKRLGFTIEAPGALSGSDIEYLVKVAVDDDGNRYAVGFTDDDWAYGEEVDRAHVVKYSRSGERLAQWTSFQDGSSVFVKGTKDDAFNDVALTADGIVAVGTAGGRTLIARFSRDLVLRE